MFLLRFSELEASRTAADAQAAKQARLEKQLEAALLDKKRLQDLDSGESHVFVSAGSAFVLARDGSSVLPRDVLHIKNIHGVWHFV